MQGFSDSTQQVKKLGELLQESGFVSDVDLARAVDLSRKNFQSLGKVLVGFKMCKEEVINSALEIQKLCKLEGMTGKIAVRALSLMHTQLLTLPEALEQVSWTKRGYSSFAEPEDVNAAKREMKDVAPGGIPYANGVEKIGDAYARNKLLARAECKYEEAIAVYEKCLPDATADLSGCLSKMSTLAIEQKRHDDANAFLKRAQGLVGTENKHSKEYAKVLHVSAEYNVSRRKFADAEKQYVEAFKMLEPMCGLQDDEVLDTIRKYVANMDKAKRELDKTPLGELFTRANVITPEQLTQAWQHSRKAKVALGRALIELGLVTENDLQMALQSQVLVRNGEATTQLAIWIVMYCNKLNKSLDAVLEMFKYEPKSRSALAQELKDAAKSLSDLETRLPPTHTELAFAYAKIANIYFKRQQWEEAENHYKRALEIVFVNPNLSVEKALEVMDNFFELKIVLNDLDEAIKVAKLSIQMRSRHYGQTSLAFATGVEKLADVFCKKGDHVTAVGCIDRSIVVKEKLYGDDAKELIAPLEAKGTCLIHADELSAAEPVLDRAYAIADVYYGRQSEVTDSILSKLVHVCKSTGNLDKVAEIAPNKMKDELFI